MQRKKQICSEINGSYRGRNTQNVMISVCNRFTKFLENSGYSEPTIKSYYYRIKVFLTFYSKTPPIQITPLMIKEYLINLVVVKKQSVSSQNNTINALKIFFNDFLEREVDDYYLPRPKRANQIPHVLNEIEVKSILKQITDLRDKCMIYLVYSAGLKPTEIVYLKPGHIDIVRMKIFISSPHGDRDRYVILSKKLIPFLREYYKKYKPTTWLFESRPGVRYSRRTLQKSFKAAVLRSGTSKRATLTILKNSFAVHLIEKGVDVRYIQKLLGLKKTASAFRFLKASKRDLKAIKSPLDNLDI